MKKIKNYGNIYFIKNNFKNNSLTIANNSKQTTLITENVEHNTKDIAKTNNSKYPKVLEIVMLAVAVISVYIAYLQYKDSHIFPSQYEIYLNSEYTKLNVNAETELTVTSNFKTDSISISAYLNSVMDGDTLLMTQKNETEWHKKVCFEHIGTYEVIATAVAPNGDTIEKSIEIEVISSDIDNFSQFFKYIK